MTAAPPDRRAIITEALRKIDDLTARLEIAEKADTEPIAVVGIGCRLPGGVNNADEYWKLLQDGAQRRRSCAAGTLGRRRILLADDHTVPGTICNREGGFITSWQPDEFDAEFFSIAPREAAAMDPQQRLLLEVAWEALENAGINPHAHPRNPDLRLRRHDHQRLLPFLRRKAAPRGYRSLHPVRECAELRRRAVVVFPRRAWPRSGHAIPRVHRRWSRCIWPARVCAGGKATHALAAGVNLILSPENSIACSRWGMLAPDGHCKTFDADADGYVRSEGCGVVVLKRLTDALRDGDRVLAVVRGSAVNQDGASSGQTVPNGPAQQALMRQALAASRLAPSDIDYIEAHGTGTALGDPIELDALSQVFSERDGSAPLVLGSVKTNLGPSGVGCGHRGIHQDGAQRAPRLHSQTPPLQAVDPARQRGRIPFHHRVGADGVAERRPCAPGRRVLLRCQRHQRPRGDRAGPGCRTRCARQPEPPVSTLVVSGKTPARIAVDGRGAWPTGWRAQAPT